MLYDLLRPSDQYHLDCASHDADDSRQEGSPWYRVDSFEALVLLYGAYYADMDQFRPENRNRYLAREEERERNLMSACDVNVHVNVIAP